MSLAVIFDLDGTLIDSAPAIQKVGTLMLAELGLPALTLEETRSYIGNGARVFVQRALAARGAAADLDAAHHRFEHFYEIGDPRDNTPYPDVVATLQTLRARGIRLGLCTNKPGKPTQIVLRGLGWEGFFDAVFTGDSLPQKKPDPAPLLACAAALGAARTIYVGDSEVDAETAQRAGLPFLLFSQGYCKQPHAALPHRARFDHWAELPALIA